MGHYPPAWEATASASLRGGRREDSSAIPRNALLRGIEGVFSNSFLPVKASWGVGTESPADAFAGFPKSQETSKLQWEATSGFTVKKSLPIAILSFPEPWGVAVELPIPPPEASSELEKNPLSPAAAQSCMNIYMDTCVELYCHCQRLSGI